MSSNAANAIRAKGFTLLELVMVLVVMGLLAVAVAASLSGDDNDLSKEAEVLRMRLRYTQAYAMGKGRDFGVSCTNRRYFMFQGTATGTPLHFPGESSTTYALPSDISISNFLVSFDEWGTPYSDAAHNTPLSNDMTINMSTSTGSGTKSQTITVTAVTGLVP